MNQKMEAIGELMISSDGVDFLHDCVGWTYMVINPTSRSIKDLR